MADVLALEVDFFSIGTGPIQLQHPGHRPGASASAKQADALHPSVLRLIGKTVEGAHNYGKWVGVCGGLASETLAVPALIGLGVDELSVSVPSIPTIMR